MARRWWLTVVVFLAAVSAAPPAAALTPLWSQPVDGAARLYTSDAATVVWAAQDGATTSILARHYNRKGEPLGKGPAVVASGIKDLGGWVAAPQPGAKIMVAWKDGGTVYVAAALLSGRQIFAPVAACTDAAVAQRFGPGTVAAPVGMVVDRAGGAYLVLRTSPSGTAGDSLLQHVSPLGVLAAPDPGATVADGSVAFSAGDTGGHILVLLGGPGRNGVALQRYGPTLTADWAQAATPYSPLLGPPPTTAQTPAGLTGGVNATMAWLESGKLKLQRFGLAGTFLWAKPAETEVGADPQIAADGNSGTYIASTSGGALLVHHVLADGRSAQGGTLTPEGGAPVLGAIVSDRAGDLTLSYDDGTTASVAQMTWLGQWIPTTLTPAATAVPGLGGDGAGGVFALGAGAAGTLWHLAEPGDTVTLRPRLATVDYGQPVWFAGYATSGGEPLAGALVQLVPAGGTPTAVFSADGQGFFQKPVVPEANATWTAVVAASTPLVSQPTVVIEVVPKVTLLLKGLKSGDKFYAAFAGQVKPDHAGSQVEVQLQGRNDTWKTVARGALDARSQYKLAWRVPKKTATYTFRTVLPAHADHAEGVSAPAKLRVTFKPR